MQVSADLQNKIAQLEKYDDAYHNGKAIISDAAYDLFKDSILRQLPPDHDLLSKVGHAPSSAWPKEKHTIFMGSQNKATTEDEIKAWVKDALARVGVKAAKFILQHKLDGFSLEMKYTASKLSSAVTRGDGSMGENVTPNARLFRGVPTVLPIANTLAVRGEGVIPNKMYADLQKKVGDKYENPRNAASGISRRLDGSHSTYIHVIAYDVTGKAKTETEKIEALKKLGFNTVPTYECETEGEILSWYRKFKAERDKLPYAIDGLVLKFDSIELQEVAGVEKNKPLGQVALKFESDQALTSVAGIALQVGRTGRITPVAEFTPVKLMGTTVARASLHNFDYIKEKFIGIGAEVTIEKRGDIIPQIVEVVNPGKGYDKPDTCPSCGSKLYDDGVNLWCFGARCRDRDVARIAYWLETINVKGFSGRFVDTLYGMGKVKSVADLYTLTEQDLASVQGLGQKTIVTFLKALKSTSEMHLSKFITALGISGCATSTAELLMEKFGSWDAVSSAKEDDLVKISGIGDVSAATLVEGVREVDAMARDILKAVKIKKKVDGPLSGKSFCVTGSLASMDRKSFQEFVIERGGTAKTSVSSDLGYLVTNDPTSGSSKNDKARKMGVKVISEDEFFKIAGGRPEIPTTGNSEPVADKGVQIITESLFEDPGK
jgi:DNA ligase (NAD+)